jgi:hypothetical protein
MSGPAGLHTEMGASLSQNRRPESRGDRRAWVIVIALVLAILGWNILAWRAIGNRPRTWSYRSAPTTPAASYGSTESPPPNSQVPKQMELPPSADGQPERTR